MSVARVMETMSSWESSWVDVPVRWGSCGVQRGRGGGRGGAGRGVGGGVAYGGGGDRAFGIFFFFLFFFSPSRSTRLPRILKTYPRGEPLHQAAYQACIAIHCASRVAGPCLRLL